MAIYSFSPFGYEGSLVNVETDLRRGIPALDIVGLADNAVKDSRERSRAAITNSGFEFPVERVLISLSPADLKKEGAGFDLPIALSILSAKDDYPRSQSADVLVMGELELSGKLRSVRGVYPALVSAVARGIKYAILPEGVELAKPNGIHTIYVKDLREAYDALVRIDEYEAVGNGEFDDKTEEKESKMNIEFVDTGREETLDTIEGHNGLKYAMTVAVAGRHNILAYGAPGCGKTMILQRMGEITPKLLPEEAQSTTRIHSIAGLLEPSQNLMEVRPFRMPHQTASIEGMCGGGANCRPGEISLAHNGVLFLDEAAEFRTSVLMMLRVPLESGHITLSRAGRSTVYPANFQLAIATNPCPCGNYGSKDKVCLCSARTIDLYWRKFSAPLLDRIAIRFNCESEKAYAPLNLETMREMVKRAWEKQYARQGKLNSALTPSEEAQFIKLSNDASIALNRAIERNNLSARAVSQIKRVAQTLVDMHNTRKPEVTFEYLEMALSLCARIDTGIEQY